MTTFAEHKAAPNEDAENESRTGMPGISTWKGVYIAVLLIFAALVGVMSIFGLIYS